MAVMRIQRMGEDFTFDMYEAAQKKMGVEDDPPAGLIMHSIGEVDGAHQIVDVWESEEDADRFGAERIGPAVRELSGGHAPPAPVATVYELKNLMKP